jgi:hypothetical protein
MGLSSVEKNGSAGKIGISHKNQRIFLFSGDKGDRPKILQTYMISSAVLARLSLLASLGKKSQKKIRDDPEVKNSFFINCSSRNFYLETEGSPIDFKTFENQRRVINLKNNQ